MSVLSDLSGKLRLTVRTPPALRLRAVTQRGPAGPAGPMGPGGDAGSGYEHRQTAAAAVWTVNHNLGRRPNVCVLTPSGFVMIAAVQHVSDNIVQVSLDDPMTGRAVCS